MLVSVSLAALGLGSAAHASILSQVYAPSGDGQSFVTFQSGSGNVIGTDAQPFVQQNGVGTAGNAITILQSGSGNVFGTDAQPFVQQNGVGTGNQASMTRPAAAVASNCSRPANSTEFPQRRASLAGCNCLRIHLLPLGSRLGSSAAGEGQLDKDNGWG